ncbi:TPA: LPS O-antigen length regulator Wzz(fepE) [Escherichia coli]
MADRLKYNEIDLFEVIGILWCHKKWFLIAFVFAVGGLFIAFIIPYNWTSVAIITPADSVRLAELDKALIRLRVLNVDVKIDKEELFNLFIKKFKSTSLLEEYLRLTPYVRTYIKNKENDEEYLYRTVVKLSEGMSAVSDNIGLKKNDAVPYVSWTLSFMAPSGEDARDLLAGYINYVSENVVRTVMQNVREQVAIKIQYEKEKLTQDRVKLRNLLDAKIRRLSYSLEIASAAGVIKPPYSNGQAIKDDPDFPISLGVDGIKRKLEIERELTDITEINGDLLNRQYMVDNLTKLQVDDVEFIPFNYQTRPSLPVRHNGLSKLMIVTISFLIGFVISCVCILLRDVITSKKSEVVIHNRK